MSENIILKKTFALAVEAVKISRELQSEKKEYIISKQLLRSATSVAAMTREAQQAESKADFIHKMSVALKEANETEYWMELLAATNITDGMKTELMMDSLKESVKMLTSIVKTAKANNKSDN
ncbi:MAG: four helix bundle protein [Bacteroidia bacterium]